MQPLLRFEKPPTLRRDLSRRRRSSAVGVAIATVLAIAQPVRAAPPEAADSQAAPADPPTGEPAQPNAPGPAEDAPERMPPLLIAASSTMFGAVVLGAVGAGVFFGLAERQREEAQRLATGVDPATGSRFVDAAAYEGAVDRRRAYQWTSRGFLIAAGAALATSIALFVVHARRRENARRRTALRGGPFGIELRF